MLQELKAVAEAVVAFIKSPRLVITIAAVCAAMLFLPSGGLSLVGVSDLATEFRQWWGLGLLASGLYIVVIAGEKAWSTVASKRADRAAQLASQEKEAALERKRQELIDGLATEELQRLRAFVVEGKAAVYFDYSDGVAARLVAARILQVHVRSFDLLEGVPHSITPWAKAALQHRAEELAELAPYRRPKVF